MAAEPARKRDQDEQPSAPVNADHAGKPNSGKELVAALEAEGIIGMWRHCEDIADSSAFARQLREQAETR